MHSPYYISVTLLEELSARTKLEEKKLFAPAWPTQSSPSPTHPSRKRPPAALLPAAQPPTPLLTLSPATCGRTTQALSDAVRVSFNLLASLHSVKWGEYHGRYLGISAVYSTVTVYVSWFQLYRHRGSLLARRATFSCSMQRLEG
jgi:hypothetical protein